MVTFVVCHVMQIFFKPKKKDQLKSVSQINEIRRNIFFHCFVDNFKDCILYFSTICFLLMCPYVFALLMLRHTVRFHC